MTPVTIIHRGEEFLVGAENFTIARGPDNVLNVELVGRLISENTTTKNHERKDAQLKKVLFHDPATIVYWTDGTKTVVKCQPGDVFDRRIGFLTALAKKIYGGSGRFNDVIRKATEEG